MHSLDIALRIESRVLAKLHAHACDPLVEWVQMSWRIMIEDSMLRAGSDGWSGAAACCHRSLVPSPGSKS